MDDRALVDAVRAGDRDAFGTFVELETRAVYRARLRILGRPHDAEDVTQEAFVAAYRSIGSYRGDGPLGAWIMWIATRQAFRRLSERRPTADLDEMPEPRLADTGASPVGVVVAAERARELRQAGAVASRPLPGGRRAPILR